MRIKTIILLCFIALTVSAQKRVAILGDSYSTYQGFITPSTNEPWYFEPWIDERTDVADVTQTWWHQVVANGDYRLEVNNSYSGATICYTGYNGDDYSARSFITRADNLGSPDIILVFGGTNDAWANSPIGEFKYKDWKREDLYAFRPAMCYLAHYMKERYPGVEVYFIINTELKDEVTQGIKDVCNHYGMEYIELHDIAKQMGHPNIAGMKAIAEQVSEAIRPVQHCGQCQHAGAEHQCQKAEGMHQCQKAEGLHQCQKAEGMHQCQKAEGQHQCQKAEGHCEKMAQQACGHECKMHK